MSRLEQLVLPLVLLSVLIIKSGSAIQCYNCDSEQNEDCMDVKKSDMQLTDCKPAVIAEDGGGWLKEATRIDFYGADDVAVPMVCQKIVAMNDEKKSVVFRGCQLQGGKTNICESIQSKAKKNKVLIEFCETCTDDGCNKSSTLQLTNLCLLFVPLILLKAFV